MRIIIILILMLLLIIQSIRLWFTKIQLKALAYFIVDKGYTEPTTKELEQCIEIAGGETVKEWFKEQA